MTCCSNWTVSLSRGVDIRRENEVELLRRLLHETARSTGYQDSLVRCRPAFTLVELLVVLGVLVVMASLSWPSLMRYVEENSLRQNAELVRRELANTRVLAIESGLTYQFRFEPQGRDFVILPFHDPQVSTNDSKKVSQNDEPRPAKVKTVVGHLSEGTTFGHVIESSDTPSDTGGHRLGEKWLAMLKDGALYTDTAWSAPVLFRPHGASADTRLLIRDKSNRSVTFSVRGLTGAVRVGRIQTAEVSR